MKHSRSKLKGNKNAIGDIKKPRLSLIPKDAIWSMANAFTKGELKYGSHNWREGIKITFLLDGSLRHIHQFLEGEDLDEDTQNLHLGNAMAGLAMAISMYYNVPASDDRYKGKKKK